MASRPTVQESSRIAWPPSLAALHDVIAGKALPLWAGAGVDPRTNAFLEQLHLDGRPDPDTPRRMRVQARQIYVYAHATLLGLFDGRDLAIRAFDRMMADYWHPEGGFIFSVAPDGRMQDGSQTTYDQAFGLLAMAWLHRLTGSQAYLDRADSTLAFLDVRLADRQHGGYADHVGAPSRCQNPHMHLLEAVLSLYEATGEVAYLHRADALYDLFLTRFLDRSIPALREFFDAAWRPDPVRGDHLDPGHHLEWIWLQDRYRLHRPDAEDAADLLLAFTTRYGVDPGDGLVVDEVTADGRILRGTKRMWPQTEHLKAQTVRFRTSAAPEPDGIDRVCAQLLDHYVDPATGAWNDQVSESGQRLSSRSPASSFYHLFLAYAEAVQAVQGKPQV